MHLSPLRHLPPPARLQPPLQQGQATYAPRAGVRAIAQAVAAAVAPMGVPMDVESSAEKAAAMDAAVPSPATTTDSTRMPALKGVAIGLREVALPAQSAQAKAGDVAVVNVRPVTQKHPTPWPIAARHPPAIPGPTATAARAAMPMSHKGKVVQKDALTVGRMAVGSAVDAGSVAPWTQASQKTKAVRCHWRLCQSPKVTQLHIPLSQRVPTRLKRPATATSAKQRPLALLPSLHPAKTRVRRVCRNLLLHRRKPSPANPRPTPSGLHVRSAAATGMGGTAANAVAALVPKARQQTLQYYLTWNTPVQGQWLHLQRRLGNTPW